MDYSLLCEVYEKLESTPKRLGKTAILADFFASVPTLVKGWKYPESETGISYALSFLNASVGVALLQSFDFANSGFLIFTVLINFLLAFSIYKINPLPKMREEFSRMRKEL